MDALFYTENRRTFMEQMEPGELAVFLSGELLRKSADDDYPFYANRNFVYLTGIEQKDSILMLYKGEGAAEEKLSLRRTRSKSGGTECGSSRTKRREDLVSRTLHILPNGSRILRK